MMRKKSIIHSLLIITLVLGMVGMTGCHKKDMDSTAKQQAQTEDEQRTDDPVAGQELAI